MVGDFAISTHWILTAVIFLPLAGAIQLVLAGGEDVRRLRMSALLWSLAGFLLVLGATVLFARSAPPTPDGGPQFALVHSASWFGEASRVDIRYAVGVDGISIVLLVLTGLLTPLAIWSSFSAITTRAKEYYALLLVLETGMLGVFCALDLLLFYVFFEFTLIPLFFLIGIWGGAEKARAAMKFFIFTVAGSVLTFAAVLYLAYYQYTHSSAAEPVFTLSIPKLTEFAAAAGIPAGVQWWLFLALAAGFAVKVPLFPVHTWLPLAHTEAPTAGSVILAGVLLKLGSYGFCRLSVPLLPDASMVFGPIIAALAIVGIIYGALAAWVQADMKKLVAYSSVSHMGFCMLGLFSLKMAGVTGSVVYMINHGLSTGALFLVVGMIYERYHTREISRIGGLARQMPWLAFFLIVFTLSSIGLPGLNGFIGEFLTLAGAALSQSTQDGFAAGPLGYAYAIPAATGILLGAIYMLHLCGRILFGPLVEPPHTPDLSGGLKRDLSGREIGILAPIALVCFFIGVYPKPLVDTLHPAITANVLAARALPLAPDDLGDERVAALVPAPVGGVARPEAMNAAPGSEPTEPHDRQEARHGS